MLLYPYFQVIIPGIWILAVIYRGPSLPRSFDKEVSSISCFSVLSKESKMITGMTWRALKFLAIVVLVLLYSRIVYALWFKSSDGEFTRHQQVRLQSLLDKYIVGTPRGVLNKCLYGKAPPRGPIPYTPFVYLLLTNGTPFTYLSKDKDYNTKKVLKYFSNLKDCKLVLTAV